MSSFSAAAANIFVVLFHLSFSLPLLRSRSEQSVGCQSTDSVKCVACKEAVRGIQYLTELNKTFEEIYPLAVQVCESVLDIVKLNGKYMCPGTISAYGPTVQFVAPRMVLDPLTVCQNLRYCCHSPSSVESVDFEPSLRKVQGHPRSSVPLRKDPSSLKRSQSGTSFRKWSYSSKLDTPLPSFSESPSSASFSKQDEPTLGHRVSHPDPQSETITFLQLSDIHFDAHYAESSPTDCGLHFCCRPWYNGTGSAGHYGEYNCDLPQYTLDLLMDQIESLVPAPDFIVYTGDNPPHDFWNQTWSSQLKATQSVVGDFSKRFPNTPIYPCIGNHEAWPQSQYMGTLKEYQALTRNLSVMWKNWTNLPAEAEESIALGGYYSMEVNVTENSDGSKVDRSEVGSGLRIISFNSNYGYLFNFYAFLNYENPQYKDQWGWLDKQLTEAKENGSKVLLIGHIPPGSDTNWPDYGEVYLNITKRHKDTIVGHLFGHTHKDHFQLVQDEAGVYGVVLVAPSVTPFGHINPSFRTFTMDAHSKQLLSYTQHHLDLPLANDLYSRGYKEEVRFEPSYSSSEEYSLPDLSPLSWSKLAKRFETDSDLLNKYYYNRHGQSYEKERICDARCQKRVLCEVNNIISTNAASCTGF